MDAFVIDGQTPLEGTLRVNGSKNAALPQMAAAILADGPVTLRDAPDVADIRNMARLLRELGCSVEGAERFEPDTKGKRPVSRVLTIATTDPAAVHAPYETLRTMRAGICTLGPLLAKRGAARVAMPGGCAIGARPIDIHLRGLRALGATLELQAGDLVARTPATGRLRGTRVFLGGRFGSSVLGTANVMSAATLAKGTTVIESAACEPEIEDLARMLNAMGADVRGAGAPRITIKGVESLGGTDHTVIPDRIEAGTFMVAAAITDGRLRLENCPLDAMLAVTHALNAAGVTVEPVNKADPLRATADVSRAGELTPTAITTQPHPGFPTDLQAQMTALLCLAGGNSVVTEKIFPQRFLHVAELMRLGATIAHDGATAIITGERELVGAPVMASDLRASAGLVLAAMAARGRSVVHRVYHLDRGYTRLEERLAAVGAKITRTNANEADAASAAAASELTGSLTAAG